MTYGCTGGTDCPCRRCWPEPPLHLNCRCKVVRVERRVRFVERRNYDFVWLSATTLAAIALAFLIVRCSG